MTTRMAQVERRELCDSALQVGAEEPTLCGEWTVKELVVHLLLRERSPAAVGIAVAPLAKVTDLEMARMGRRDFAVLVERLRTGPPRWSPYAVPRLDTMLNTLEFFVHHEDIRRAQPAWVPRDLDADAQKLIWAMMRKAGKPLVRNAKVGVTLENSTTGSRAVLKDASEPVVVSGLPSEVALFTYGRQQQARVELSGPDEAIAALTGSSLGF
ncbi:MAG: TIGR03085 family metal-binding protein [Nocardioides sp.]